MPNKNSKKSFPKIILVSLILIALITGVYFAIRSNLAKEEIKGLIISKLENAMERGIYIGKVKEYSLKTIVLSNFKVFKDYSFKKDDLLFEAEEMIIDYNIDISLALKKRLVLNIEAITFIKPQMTLIRDSEGKFDFMEKFNLDYRDFSDFLVKRININDGLLFYQDYLVTKEDGLLTTVKSLNGYFSLAGLPQVEFDCSALRIEDNTSLTLKGYFFTENSDYSLDFTFQDSDITHFQYYFAETKPFNLKKGLVDLELHLASDSDATQGKTIWYGKASAKDVDLSPDFLRGLEIKQAKGSATFDAKETTIEKATAIYMNSPFTLTGNLTYIDKLNYDIQVKSGDFELSDLKEGLKKYLSLSTELKAEGKSNLSFKVSGLEENFQVQGELLIEPGKIQGYDFSNLKTEFHYNQDGFHFKGMEAEIGGGIIEGSGRVSLKDELPEYNLLFNLTRIDVESDFLKLLNLDYLKQGLLSGNIEAKGIFAEGENINLKAELKLQDKTDSFSLIIDGVIDEKKYLDFKLKTVGINLEVLEKILNYQGIKGLASFSGGFSGLLDDLKITGKIEIEKGQISEFVFDYLKGEINYQDNKLRLEDVIFKNKGLAFKGKGNIDLLDEKDIHLDLTLQVEQADLNYLTTLYNYDLPVVLGLAQGEIFLQGNWPGVIAKGDLQLKDVDLVGYKAESGDISFILEDKKVKIESLVLNSGKAQVYARGEINLADDLPLNLRVNFLNQGVPDLLSNFVKSDLISKFIGQATGSLEIKGDFTSPDLYLSALIVDAQLDEVPLNSIEIKLEKIGSVLRFNRLKLIQRKGGLVAGGWVNLDEDNKNLDINISAEKLDLTQLSNLISIEDEIKGLVNFKAGIKGAIDLPDISFSAKVEQGKFQDFTFDNLVVEALYNQEILEVKQFILDKEGYQIKGKGKIPYKFSFIDKEKIVSSLADVPLNFVLTLENTDLSVIGIFFKEDIKQLQGLTNVELELSGTLNQPILNGNIAINDGLIKFYELPTKINDLNVLLRLEDNLVKIEDINFKIDQYKIYASGEFALKDLQPQELSINIWSNNEEVVYQDIFKAQANLNAKITGLFTSPYIEGVLSLSQGELNWEENKDSYPDLSAILSKFSNIGGGLDLKIEVLDDFTFKTKDFNSKLGGNIKVYGELSTPRLNGELEVKQGYITFLDRKFRISTGKVIFSDSSGKNVILDIEAKTEIDDIDVFVSVSGIISQPMVVLNSRPALSESEIISLLMFNRNYAGLTEGELGTILREEMINLIAQGLSIRFLSQIENEVANSLGLDEFKIETIFKKEQESDSGFFPGLALEGLALKFGKYFTENFYLTYSAPLYEMGKTNLGLEYRVSDDLTFSTQFGAFSPQENDFEFKIELKYGF